MQYFSREVEEMLDKVRIPLKEYFEETEGKRLYSVKPENIFVRGFSIIIFLSAETSAGTRRVVMKRIVEHPLNKIIHDGQNQLEVEYQILKYLHPRFESVEGCTVPRPLFLVPEAQAFVMEFVEGRLLSDELLHARYWAKRADFSRLQEYFFLAGRWLYNFQRITGFEQAGVEVFKSIIERCDDRLRLIEESGDSSCPKDLHRKVLALLEGQLLAIRDKNVLICGRHGDLGTWNFFVGPRGVTVIDFMGYCKEPVIVDVLKMLAALEEDKFSFLLSSRRLDFLRESFLNGVGKLPSISEPTILICEIHQRVCNLCGRVLSRPSGFHRRVERYLAIKSNVEWLMNIHERKSLLFNVSAC